MEQFISIVAIGMVGVVFLYLAGAIADLVTSWILKRLRRKKEGSDND